MKRLFVLWLTVAAILLVTCPSLANPVVFDPLLVVTPFAGAAAGGQPIASPKFSVIDAPNGSFGGMMYVSQLGGGDVVQITPAGVVLPYTLPRGAFGSGAGGVDIDAPTADLPGPTAGMYGGAAGMYVAETGAGGPVNSIAPGGMWGPYTIPPPGTAPGTAGLQFDRTPGFAYGGNMYISDWGFDASDGLLRVLPGGATAPFAALPHTDPRYFTFDATGGGTGYGPNALWVSSYATGAVFSVTPGGIANLPLAVLMPDLEGLAFGHGDALFGTDLYAANLTNGTIDKISPAGVVTPFAAGFPGAAYLQFVTAGPYAINGQPTLYVDDGVSSVWSITIPEPATLGLLSLGGLAILRRRR